MKKEIYDLLYFVEEGEDIGLREVQFIEVPSSERIEATKKILANPNQDISFQAALILTSWGIQDGIIKINEFIKSWDENLIDIFSHRINDNDTSFDEICFALYLCLVNNSESLLVDNLIIKLLELFPFVYAEDRMKDLLIKYTKTYQITNKIISTIDKTIEFEKYFQASYLLPCLFKNYKNTIHNLDYLDKFIELEKKDYRIGENIVESLSFVDNSYSSNLLSNYSKSEYPLISKKAVKVLEKR